MQVPQKKLKSIKKELGKLVTHSKMTPRKMSAILGQVRAFLTAIPALRSFTDLMMAFINKSFQKRLDSVHLVPKELKLEVQNLKALMDTWQGRVMEGKAPIRFLHSDSSDTAWAGVDLNQNTFIKDFWRENHILHINVKELQAAVHTIKSFAKRGETVLLKVDNTVTYYYLKKGGEAPPLQQADARPLELGSL